MREALEPIIAKVRRHCQATGIAGRDLDWAKERDEWIICARSGSDCVPVAATDQLYILSGTIGRPKGVVRDNGGHLVALKWSMRNLYGVEPGEVYWAASDVGWVVGHSYMVYAPLLHGCTSILYDASVLRSFVSVEQSVTASGH
jgi:propionyl-CoA synthetase